MSVSAPVFTFEKDPVEILDYFFDWSDFLGPLDTIATSTWAVSGTDAVLTVGSQTYNASLVTAWAASGTLGVSYDVSNTITTLQGRTAKRTARIVVLSR
jgi:hypothetical protein